MSGVLQVVDFNDSCYSFSMISRLEKMMDKDHVTGAQGRWKTRAVMVGSVGVGGTHPIRLQSMANTPTDDVASTVQQIIQLADQGCEIARVTVQGMKEANACEAIKNTLVKKGYDIPIVADIHFFPKAAMRVIDSVDKVRINPGNYLDKRATFKTIEYTDATYSEELQRLEANFQPLVEKCKKLHKAMRIGANHGSLSDRIMNRFGDTPSGMVEAALEYARVCRKYDFHDIVFSMKSSNPCVMIEAYRLLVAEMIKLGWDYPLHLGVTEAGEGEEGRVKSAIGIGALLADGIGDTIRVSLTEDPCREIDPCRRLAAFAEKVKEAAPKSFETAGPRSRSQRRVVSSHDLKLPKDGAVALSLTANDLASPTLLKELGCKERSQVDLVRIPRKSDATLLTGNGVETFTDNDAVVITEGGPIEWRAHLSNKPKLVLLRPNGAERIPFARRFFDWLDKEKLNVPVLLNFVYVGDWDDVIISASSECGSLLCDRLGDGLLLEGSHNLSALRNLSFQILQGCRMRAVKTEFISCPSCGRTLFDLPSVAERIRRRTGHLPGVKIAVMGCIVNGPGEMADADFGYVGSGVGKVDLYLGKTCVERGIDHSVADDKLIDLIKSQNRWIEAAQE